MPTTLALRFPWGRYHATPWGRHLNEGVVEWPPSCWRLLRGLYATWRSRTPEMEEERVESLLDALATPPTYWLPEATNGHSRHYMPDSSHRLGFDGNADKAFDPFMVFERDREVFVEWDIELEKGLRATLERLVSLLPHVGRADSICDARVLEVADEPTGERAEPIADGSEGLGTRLLVPTRPVNLEALAVDTTDLRSRRLASPPGTKWVEYRIPALPDTRRRRTPARPHDTPKAVRWAIVTSAHPSIYSTVAMCDVLRYACMSKFGRMHDDAASAILTGKDAGGVPLTGHRHAHYLAMDTDRDGLIDHFVVWVPGGLGPKELDALAALRDLRGYGHIREFRSCRLGLEVVGSIDQAAPELVGPSRTWRSATPFAPPRHRKRKQTPEEFVTAEVVRELANRDLPEPDRVGHNAGRALAFRRHRIRDRLEDAVNASMISVEFSDAVRGPITIGAHSHQGLGMFVPAS